ncbi:MAG TPA: hypothetical protein PLC74_01440 [Acetobacteraceae bacterium]|nr:hypothetical protein [Acetobacteraceae bacterium]
MLTHARLLELLNQPGYAVYTVVLEQTGQLVCHRAATAAHGAGDHIRDAIEQSHRSVPYDLEALYPAAAAALEQAYEPCLVLPKYFEVEAWETWLVLFTQTTLSVGQWALAIASVVNSSPASLPPVDLDEAVFFVLDIFMVLDMELEGAMDEPVVVLWAWASGARLTKAAIARPGSKRARNLEDVMMKSLLALLSGIARLGRRFRLGHAGRDIRRSLIALQTLRFGSISALL